mmetsp:Transcript_27193/g.38302  ORF Transcript_27193/g.38302 Transcript_27193/m.38302 type:complete len:203 (+) Transcript_27193:83-691(+)
MATSGADHDYFFKILLIGDSGVGKSCLLLRFADDSWTETHISTIGVDFKIKTLNIDGKTVKLQIWDTAGQERFRTITRSYYRGAHGVMLAFDVTDGNSFQTVGKWIYDIKKYSTDTTPVILVGTKCDLQDQRVVDADTARKFAEKNDLKYIETSAKSGDGVQEAFLALCELIMKSSIIKTIEEQDEEEEEIERKQSGCCTIM